MSGFWKFTSSYASKVNSILENKDIILEELLDERETVSELLASNSKLIEYLRRPEVLEKLIDYVVEDDEYQRKEIELDNQDREQIENSNDSKEKENVHSESEVTINGATSTSTNTESSAGNAKSHDIVLHDESNESGNDSSNVKSTSDLNANGSASTNDSTEEITATISSDEEEEEDSNFGKESSNTTKHSKKSDGSDDNHSDDNEDDEDEDEDDDEDDDEDFDNNEEETEVEKHTRRAQVAAEILSIDVWSITDAFMENVYLLQRLWCILDKPAPLPIFSATYFMKINEHLLDMKTDEMIQFIHQEPNLVERFMRHIETPPLMDFLLKVISTDKPDDSTGMIDTLKDQGLIPSLINFLSQDVPSSIQSAAGDFLKAFITISANNAENTTIGPNELTRELVSEPMVKLLVEKMLQGGTALSNGVGIVIEIIRKNNSDYDPIPIVFVTIESHPPTPRDPIYLGSLVRIFAESIPEFNKLLSKNVEKTLETPFGTIEPLGFERFKICELVAELIHCSNMALLNDPKGEEIIKDRDEIRQLLIEKHKELMLRAETDSNASMDGADISKAIENLRLSKQKDGAINEGEDSNVGEADETALINSDDENEGTPKEIVNDEPTLREAPLVGDQLKIALYDNEIIVTILDMFFKFPWNNFLHNVVFDIVQQILNATMEIGFNKYLAIDLFDRCHITKAIIDGHNRCIEYEEETGLRLGYMGHLSLIAEEVVKFISLDIHHTTPKAEKIDLALDDEEWKFYVDETLADIRNKYNAVLGSDGKQMNEHDMNLFQRVYGTSEFDDEEEDEEDAIPESNDYMDSDGRDEDIDHDIGNEHVLNGSNDDGSDKFSRYIGEEITGDLHDKFGSSDDESEEDDHENSNGRQNHLHDEDIDGIVDSQMGGHPYHEMSAGGLDDPIGMDDDIYDDDDEDDDDDVDLDSLDDDQEEKSFNKYDKFDDYEDPNDDGQSYVKNNHPLYQADGSLRAKSNEKFTSDEEQDNFD